MSESLRFGSGDDQFENRTNPATLDPMATYGQFCPVALAAEIIGERWTLLVIREIMSKSHRFSEMQRGLPLISKSVLSQRLQALIDAGVIEKRAGEYHLTRAGEELAPIVMACGEWGTRWAAYQLENEDVDLALLMWDMRRRIDVSALPDEEIWVQLEFRGAPRGRQRFWLRLEPPDVELCLTNPRRQVSLSVRTEPKTMGSIWVGALDLADAIRSGAVVLEGPRKLVRAFPSWLQRSVFADVPRPT